MKKIVLILLAVALCGCTKLIQSGTAVIQIKQGTTEGVYSGTFYEAYPSIPSFGLGTVTLQIQNKDKKMFSWKLDQVDVSNAGFNLSLSEFDEYKIVTYSWISSMGEPLVLTSTPQFNPINLFSNQGYQPVSPAYPTQYDVSSKLKVDYFIISADGNGLTTPTGDFFLILAPYYNPTNYTVDPVYNDYLIDLKSDGSLPNDGQEYPLVNGGPNDGKIRYFFNSSMSGSDVTVKLQVVIHTVQYSSSTTTIVYFTDYEILDESKLPAGKTHAEPLKPRNAYWSDNPEAIFGFNNISQSTPSINLDLTYLATNVFQSSLIGDAGKKYSKIFTGFYFYIEKICQQDFTPLRVRPGSDTVGNATVSNTNSEYTITYTGDGSAKFNADTIVGNTYAVTFNLKAGNSGTFKVLFDGDMKYSLSGSANSNGITFVGYAQSSTYSNLLELNFKVQNSGTWQVTNIRFGARKSYYNGQCVESCPVGTTPTGGLQGSICLTCGQVVGNAHKFWNPTTSQCECPAKTYDATTQCKPCTIAACLRCSQTQCILCESGDPPSAGVCQCADNFFLNGEGQCQACLSQCNGCTGNALTCLDCQPNSFRSLVGSQCPCNAGYYEAGAVVCAKCPSHCATCFQNATCQTCSPFRHNPPSCTCAPGFYQDDNGDCLGCSLYCKTCSGPDECDTCVDTRVKAGKDCVCDTTRAYVENPPNILCAISACETVTPYCTDCDNQICKTCVADRTYNNRTKLCQCNVGSSYGNGTCTACPKGCKECNGAICISCFDGAYQDENNQCKCKPGTFEVPEILACANCTQYCQNCSDETQCQVCNPTFFLNNNKKCVCRVGTFLNTTRNFCQSCRPTCAICNSTSCIQCAGGYSLTSTGDCVYNCTTTCTNCPVGCQQCKAPWVCKVCKPGFVRLGSNCLQKCPNGLYSSDGECKQCQNKCASCVDNSGNCTSCKAPYFFFLGECFKTCPPDYTPIESTRSCAKCQEKCISCFANNISKCTACDSIYYLSNWACKDACDQGQYVLDNVCYSACPGGYWGYQNGSYLSCEPCSKSCLSCTGNTSSSCSRCPVGRFLSNGACLSSCPNGRFPDAQRVCRACDLSVCTSCVAGSLDCAGCKNGQKPVGGRCDSSKCTGASYFDGKACQPCSPYCIKCQSASSCTQCITNFSPTNGYCTQCRPGCRRCDPSSSQCFECYPGLALNTIINDCVDRCQSNLKNENGYCVCINGVLDNSVCRQNCQTGYGPNLQKICEPCSEGCLSCSKVRATCEECEIGLNLVRGVCVRNMSCAVGQGQAPDGTCVNLCPSNKHFYNGYCVNACPKGTILNSSNLNCIDESPAIESCSVIDTISSSTGVCTGLKYIGCTPCRPGRFSYQSNCVNRCPVSTYPNSDNICLNCPSNCVQCNSSSNCLACAKGYYSFNGQCMQSTTCSPSQFSLGSNCVLNCPFGTYQDGTVCSPLCPAGQAYSKGWCVESCPSGTFNNTYGCDTSGNSNLGCRPNQYYDEGAKSCQPCNERCGSCVRFSQFCTTCVVGWPDGNGGCTGSGRAVQIHYINGSRDDKIVSLQFNVSYIPSGLSPSQLSQLLLVSVYSPKRNSVKTIETFQFFKPPYFYVNLMIDNSSTETVYVQLNIPAVGKQYNDQGYSNFKEASSQVDVSTVQKTTRISNQAPSNTMSFAATRDQRRRGF